MDYLSLYTKGYPAPHLQTIKKNSDAKIKETNSEEIKTATQQRILKIKSTTHPLNPKNKK